MTEITTFGSFSIKINGKNVSDSFKKTTKLLQLLSLLLINRNKPLPIRVICDAIWDDVYEGDEIKALHNLIYRLRNIFTSKGEQDCIVFSSQTYVLNPELDLRVDAYQMDEYYNKALDPMLTDNEVRKLLEKAVALYNGEYLLNFVADDIYVQTVTKRYRRLFVDIVCRLADLYMDRGEYDKMFLVCDRAIVLEPLEESIYLRIIRGMRKRGMDTQAADLIEHYFDILYREVGICASETLNNIYKELKSHTVYTKHDVEQVLDELKELDYLNKALFCNFDAFKDIYRYEARQLSRRDYTISVVLMEIYSEKHKDLPDKMLAKAKRILHECCMLALRKGDMFSNYSKAQSVAMLTLKDGKDAVGIISRINNTFNTRIQDNAVSLRFEVRSSLSFDD